MQTPEDSSRNREGVTMGATHRDRFTIAALAAMCVVATGAIALLALRRPATLAVDTKLRSGTHLTYVLIAPTSTAAEPLADAIRGARTALRALAAQDGYLYSTVGISEHWSVASALRILEPLGPFDELIVGRNWLNTGVERYVTELHGTAAVPQVLVMLRQIDMKSILRLTRFRGRLTRPSLGAEVAHEEGDWQGGIGEVGGSSRTA